MKKILLILFSLTFCLFVFSQTEVINVGTVANDGTGDKLRNAMIKVNTNFTSVRDSFGNIYRETQTRTLINDSLNQVRTDALELSDIGFLKSDTNDVLATKTDILNIEGGSGVSGKFYYLSGNIDDTGFPGSGDTALTHSNFIGKHITVIREGQIQQQHADNTEQDGFWLDNAAGIIRVRPAFSTGEQIEIWSTSTIQWEALAAEGQESALLTNLRAYWAMDEISGSVVNDELNTYDGTTNATINQSGKSGVAELFNGTDDVAAFGTSVGDIGTSDLSYSLWIYIDNLPSANKGIIGNFNGVSTFWYLRTKADNGLSANFNADDDPQYTTESNGGLSADTWYNIVVTLDRSGNQVMYINGTAQTDVDDISPEVAVAVNNNAQFNIGNIGDSTATYFIAAKIDEVAIWVGRVLSQSDVTELYNAGAGKFYPF